MTEPVSRPRGAESSSGESGVTDPREAGRSVRRRGELEHLVLQLLWDSPTPMTARAVQDGLAGQRPAITTVLTVLDRLRGKELVQRHEGQTAMTFTPSQSQSDHTVQAMLTSLTTTSDRRAALLQFAGDLDDSDADILRDALAAQRRRRNR